jgi:hypothetical protein
MGCLKGAEQLIDPALLDFGRRRIRADQRQ